jgi:hypothetical protein
MMKQLPASPSVLITESSRPAGRIAPEYETVKHPHPAYTLMMFNWAIPLLVDNRKAVFHFRSGGKPENIQILQLIIP